MHAFTEILDKRQKKIAFPTSIHFYLLFYYLHLLLDRHSSNAEGRAQLRSSLLLQQLAVVLDNAVRLPRQLSLEKRAGY